ncbi:uncharacterized protein LOC121980523 isoform X2 [Zingiber officinale]|uniref:uncharacterized protein LOC121980523 isoform X2 n=1 Tax=Zingiber officinale TaxID=94328 RepID=UPI001C4D6ED6|nr:uncharacterized protein LOC121980523 isoform X2 [Zingiber officinale]XP_042388527.1 uncharacterized protein LOC121980523 isoform X2 [Zingiber officinale]
MQSSVLCDDDEINRTILWKRGRLNKEGEFVGDELKQTVNKIIKKNADVLVVYGLSSANTSLTLAKAMLLQDQTTVVVDHSSSCLLSDTLHKSSTMSSIDSAGNSDNRYELDECFEGFTLLHLA